MSALTQPKISSVFEDPKVQALKNSWVKQYSHEYERRTGITFEKLFLAFRTDPVDADQLAKKFRVTQQRINQLYKLFESYFGDRIKRKKLYNAQLMELKRQAAAEHFLYHGEYQEVFARALRKGCLVEPIPYYLKGRPTGRIKSTQVRINGHHCYMHHITKPFMESRLLCHASVGRSILAKPGWQIFYLTIEELPPRIFVVPNSELRRTNGTSSTTNIKYLYLPLMPTRIYHNHLPTIDFWPFEEEWPKSGDREE